MTLFRVWFSLLIMTFIASGCVKPSRGVRHDQEMLQQFSEDKSLIAYNNRAMFQVGEIQLEDIKFSNLSQGDWKQVDQIQLYFKLCNIVDKATQGTIRNEKFHISSELGSNILWSKDGKRSDEANKKSLVYNPITVNSANCLRWSQSVPVFDFLAPSMNIALHFQIESLSGNLGKIVKRIGFNPWDMYRNKSKSKNFMDLSDFDRSQWYTGQWATGDNVIRALKGELIKTTAELRFKNISVEPVEREKHQIAAYNKRLSELSEEERKIRKEIEEKLLLEKSGVQINLNFIGKPVIWMEDSTGIPTTVDVDTGRFLVYMNLVASGAADNSEKHLLSSNVTEISGRHTTFEWSMNKDKLLAASVPLLLRKRTELGSVELVVKIEPRSAGLKKLKPFEAVFNLGQYSDWIKKQSPSYEFDELHESMDQVDYDKYLDKVVGIDKIDRNIKTIRDMKRFYFRPLKMRFVRIMPGESATDRTLQYSVTTCVENWRGKSVGRGLQFNVETEDKGLKRLMRRETNEDGCLTWFGTLSHKYYRREVLEARTAKVTYVGTINNGKDGTYIEGKKRSKNTVINNVDQRDSIINGYEQTFTYYMNPWDEKWTFGWDEPDMPANYYQDIIRQRRNAPKSQLFIADFRYETMGFRYAIDKYLNLKVKKAILLKAFPYVLKYNSILSGRLGTQKLRDGIYLMKVALQKDYLDPSAKGVRIYDQDLEKPFEIANEKNGATNPKEFNPNMSPEDLPQNAYDKYNKDYADSETIIGEKRKVKAGMDWVDENGESHPLNQRLLNAQELKDTQKEYITVQTKLVRVMGGMIITPVEFEVDDLRLMRIRNQFFIQLQTIDEHKLRYATAIDQAIKGMFNLNSADMTDYEKATTLLNDQYNAIFAKMDELQTLQDDSDKIKELLNQYVSAQQRARAISEMYKITGSMQEIKQQLYAMLGLDEVRGNAEEFEKRRKAIQTRLERLDQYRQMKNQRYLGGEAVGLQYLTEFRNDKRDMINRILESINKSRDYVSTTNVENSDQKNIDAISKDPFLKFMFFGSYFDGKKQDMTAMIQKELGVDIDSLKFSDFSSTPLTPSFDFELLRNDGVHDPDKKVDDGLSGLPSRTFVGPLTFVFNTNGSSLRPTDVLNENYCRTAFCEEPEKIKLNQSPSTTKGKIAWGIPPEKVDSAITDSSEFALQDLTQNPIYDSGDSVNAGYENNKYYGYLKAYHNMTVDKLIQQKIEIERNNERKMQEGSQIINFVKTMGLKYTLLNDNPASRLKSIEHDQCAVDTSRDINECLTDVRGGNDVLSRSDLFSMLNERGAKNRHYRDVQDSDSFDNQDYYNVLGQDDVTSEDLERVMTYGWKSSDIDPALARKLMHRMCYVLSQNFFKEKYFDKKISTKEKWLKAFNKDIMNSRSLYYLERTCHRFVGQMYGYYHNKSRDYEGSFDRNKLLSPDTRPRDISFSPIVLERKVRTYETTKRYVYRGGKSLNINLSTGFNLSSSHGIKISTSGSYKPWDQVTGIVDSTLGRIPVIGKFISNIIGSFNITRSNSHDESAGKTQGTSVSSGTFLVSQQASFDIELGEYERCLVARFHPAFIKAFISIDGTLTDKPYLKNNFVASDVDYNEDGIIDELSDINKQGIMICTGRHDVKPLPISEKYYYLTQHFTAGDMLDTADLHNHPWLLQLRGERDFQVFTSSIGAREVSYIDNNQWVNDVMMRTVTDAAAMKLQGSNVDNLNPELQVVDRSDINWPLEELSRSYFEVLPTFPGLYTYMNETGENVSDWPYDNTNPGRSFDQEGQ